MSEWVFKPKIATSLSIGSAIKKGPGQRKMDIKHPDSKKIDSRNTPEE